MVVKGHRFHGRFEMDEHPPVTHVEVWLISGLVNQLNSPASEKIGSCCSSVWPGIVMLVMQFGVAAQFPPVFAVWETFHVYFVGGEAKQQESLFVCHFWSHNRRSLLLFANPEFALLFGKKSNDGSSPTAYTRDA